MSIGKLIKHEKHMIWLSIISQFVSAYSVFSIIGFKVDIVSWEVTAVAEVVSAAFCWDWEFNRVKVGVTKIILIAVGWNAWQLILKKLAYHLRDLLRSTYIKAKWKLCSWLLFHVVSLLHGKVTMEFRHPDGRHVPVVLPRRSLLVMTGESRYLWSHG